MTSAPYKPNTSPSPVIGPFLNKPTFNTQKDIPPLSLKGNHRIIDPKYLRETDTTPLKTPCLYNKGVRFKV